jgi:hypothetical protein
MGGGIQRGRGWREPAPNGKLTSTANLVIRQANLSSGSRVFWPALVRPTLVPVLRRRARSGHSPLYAPLRHCADFALVPDLERAFGRTLARPRTEWSKSRSLRFQPAPCGAMRIYKLATHDGNYTVYRGSEVVRCGLTNSAADALMAALTCA